MNALISLAIAFVFGIALGIACFVSLGHAIRRIVAGRLRTAIALQLVRAFTLAGALVAVALAGALPLTGAVLGMVVARHVVLGVTRPTARGDA